jgi:hypothetical protein
VVEHQQLGHSDRQHDDNGMKDKASKREEKRTNDSLSEI